MDRTAFFNKYNGSAIADCGVYQSEEFKKFARDMKNTIKKSAEEKGYRLAAFSRGHYHVFGFFEKNEKYIYFSFDCPRGELPLNLSASDALEGFLYRTAKNLQDYRGDSNHFTNWNNFFTAVSALFEKQMINDCHTA